MSDHYADADEPEASGAVYVCAFAKAGDPAFPYGDIQMSSYGGDHVLFAAYHIFKQAAETVAPNTGGIPEPGIGGVILDRPPHIGGPLELDADDVIILLTFDNPWEPVINLSLGRMPSAYHLWNAAEICLVYASIATTDAIQEVKRRILQPAPGNQILVVGRNDN